MATFRCNVKGWRFYIGLSYSAKATGVNSKLEDGRHFLMWDFDNVALPVLRRSLIEIQRRFLLSSIYVLSTGLEGHYHAYCFDSLTFSNALQVIAATKESDRVYLGIAAMRGYFTLRFSDKKGRVYTHVDTLESPKDADISPYEVKSFCRYWTKRL